MVDGEGFQDGGGWRASAAEGHTIVQRNFCHPEQIDSEALHSKRRFSLLRWDCSCQVSGTSSFNCGHTLYSTVLWGFYCLIKIRCQGAMKGVEVERLLIL